MTITGARARATLDEQWSKDMHGRIEGKVAIITGAGSGIGRAMALRLAAEGASIVAVDISGAEEDVAREIGPCAIAVRADLSDPAGIEDVVRLTVDRFGQLDILCNNAGRSGGVTPLHETRLDLFDRVIETNMRGAFLMAQAAIRQMLIHGGGTIVNTASIASIVHTPGTTSYSMSKSAVMALTRAAAVEYADRGIRVNAILPGVIATPMVAAAPQATRHALSATIPMGRFGTAEEIASVALFLVSDEAAYVTGIGIAVDGGKLARA